MGNDGFPATGTGHGTDGRNAYILARALNSLLADSQLAADLSQAEPLLAQLPDSLSPSSVRWASLHHARFSSGDHCPSAHMRIVVSSVDSREVEAILHSPLLP